MGRVVYWMSVSLDGFIETNDMMAAYWPTADGLPSAPSRTAS